MHLKNIIYKSHLRELVTALPPVTERLAVGLSLPVFMTPDVARLEYSRSSVKPKPIYQQSSSLLWLVFEHPTFRMQGERYTSLYFLVDCTTAAAIKLYIRRSYITISNIRT